MKRFAVVLCSIDEDVTIKFLDAEDWRAAALEAALQVSAENPLWNCLDVPDEVMQDGEEGENEDIPEPIMVPISVSEAMQDGSNADMIFAIAEVPA